MTSDPKNMRVEEIMATLRREAERCGTGEEFCLLGEDFSWGWDDSRAGATPLDVAAQTLQDFLVLPCEQLVQQGYAFFLGREPDLEGQSRYLGQLQNRQLHPVDFLVRLRLSREGRSHPRKLPGMFTLFLFVHAGRIPVLGWILQLFLAPFVLPLVLALPVAGSRMLAREMNRMDEWESRVQEQYVQTQRVLQKFEKTTHDHSQQLLTQKQQVEELLQDMQDHEVQMQSLRRQCLDNTPRVLSPAPVQTHKNTPAREGVPDLDQWYVEFEDQFRGTREQIKQKLEPYLSFVGKGSAPYVLDLGCGRGEWLELLAQQGIPAVGVDTNAIMVQEGRKAGLAMELADALEYLREQPENSFSAITSFHLIEHLPFVAQVMFLDEVYRVLAPGGVLILETPNPRNILVGSGDFYRDPTHQNPVFPDTLAFMARQRGFARGHIFWKEPSALIPAKGKTFDSLDDYVTVGRDYAYIGYVPCV